MVLLARIPDLEVSSVAARRSNMNFTPVEGNENLLLGGFGSDSRKARRSPAGPCVLEGLADKAG